jgi:hypothetical protein
MDILKELKYAPGVCDPEKLTELENKNQRARKHAYFYLP